MPTLKGVRSAQPSVVLQALELPRAIAEFAAMVATAGLLLRAPRGDGSHVVVLPGFTASDGSTLALRSILERLGHRPVSWGLGYNVGPTREVVDGVDSLVRRLHEEDGRTVQIVGWSLGGVFARHVAARRPEILRRVITLGSPYRITRPQSRAAGWMYGAYAPLHRAAPGVWRGGAASRALAVPTTSIYSPSDGVVSRASCTETETELAEIVAVHGSHNGLGHNPLAMYVVADRLALPPGALPRFEPPCGVRSFFGTGSAPQTRRGVKAGR
jgi:pimeloyl-ACP methyl ester carboxylesterase